MRLNGVKEEFVDNSLIIGQRLIASVEFESPATEANTKHIWAMPGGAPFADYIPSNSSATVVPYVLPPQTGQSSKSTTIYFSNPTEVNVQCTVELTDPNLSFVLSEKVPLEKPTVGLSIQAQIGQFFLASESAPGVPVKNPPNPEWLWLLHTATNPPIPGGYTLRMTVTDPPGFGPQLGLWEYTQLVTPNSWLKDPNGVTVWSEPMSGQEGLDGTYPYQGALIGGPHACTLHKPFSDSPRINLSDIPNGPQVGQAHYEATMRLFILYMPPGTESKWVSVHLFSWGATGTATKVNGVWTITQNAPNLGTNSTHYVHPTWTFAHT